MESTEYHSPSKGKVTFFYILFVALAGFMIYMWFDVFAKSAISTLLNVTKLLLLNLEKIIILSSTDVHDLEKKICE